MPCNCDHLNATNREIELSKIACLLDELDGYQIHKPFWEGYHPSVYNKNVDGDAMISKLCAKLQTIDVKQYSLEMQIWWRDHQADDKARIEREIAEKKTAEARTAALEKLTKYERELLGV